ncbi:MAG: hypothetical protein QNL33_07420 [Akkermansiaceae bacterium]|jgi:hypothetical protein
MNSRLIVISLGLIAGGGLVYFSDNGKLSSFFHGGNADKPESTTSSTTNRDQSDRNSQKLVGVQEDIGLQLQALIDDEEFKLYDLLRLAERAGARGKEACAEFLDEVDRRLDGELRESAYARALEALVFDDPNWVFEQAARLGVGRQNRSANYKLLSALAGKNPETAVDIVNRMEFPEERESGVRSLRSAMVGNPNLIRILLNRDGATDEVRSGLLSIAGDVWKGDVADLIKESGVEAQPSFREEVLSSLAGRRPSDVLEYYESAVDAAPSQKTLSRLASGLMAEGASKSMEVVMETRDFAKRDELAGMLYARWLIDDSLGASSWLQTTENLEQNPQLKKRLVSIIVERMKAQGETDLANEWSKLGEK